MEKRRSNEAYFFTDSGRKNILLVDSERPLLYMVAYYLGRAGYKVIEKNDYREALRVFMENSDWFNLVIADYYAPNLGGFDFACEISKINPRVPIVLYSTNSLDKSEFKEVEEVIRKPFLVKEVIDAVEKIIGPTM